MITSPEVLFNSPEMIPIAVVLPAPLEPNNAKKSPFSTFRLIPFKASSLLEYVLARLSVERARDIN